MPQFSYKAYSSDGTHKVGKIESESDKEASLALMRSGIQVYEIVEGAANKNILSGISSSKKTKSKELSSVFRSLAMLTTSGFTFDQSLSILRETMTDRTTTKQCDTALRTAQSGETVAKSLETAFSFPQGILAIIQYGEASGNLEAAFDHIATSYEEQEKLKKDIVAAITYPIFLVCLLLIVVVLLSVQLVPALVPIFSAADAPLPILMQVLIDFGVFIADYGLIISCFLIFCIVLFYATPVGSKLKTPFNRLLRSIPVLGPFLKRVSVAKFLRSFSTLLVSKVQLQEAIKLSANAAVTNSDRRALLAAARSISEGNSLKLSLEQTTLLDVHIISLIAIGEETDNLPQMVSQCSKSLDQRIRTTINRALATLSPLLTIVIGLLVGGLVISLMTALLNLNDVVLN